MFGGSLALLPVISDERFLAQAAEMKAVDAVDSLSKQYLLSKVGTGYILYSNSYIKNLKDD
jgi:hypothetical protein